MKSIFTSIAISLIVSCNNAETSSTTSDNTSSSELNTTTDSVALEPENEFQIIGIGLINRGYKKVSFFELGYNEYELNPGKAVDFRIVNYPTILMIVGQNDQWEVEKGRRYQLVYLAQHEKWNIEEVN